MAKVTGYIQIESSLTNCFCQYMRSNYDYDVTDGDSITPVQIDASLDTQIIRIYTNTCSSFSNDGAFFHPEKMYMQKYNLTDGVLEGEKIFPDENLQASRREVRINKDCNFYGLITSGYCLVIDHTAAYAPKGKVVYNGNMRNCTCNYAANEEYTEEKRNIVITANEGYEFFGTEYHYTDSELEEMPLINEGYRLISQTEEPYKPIYWTGQDILLDMEYVADRKPEEIASFVNVYNMTNEELSSFAHSRFHVDAQSNVTDMGQFISGLYVLPFVVPDELKSDEKKPLVLGNFTSEITSTVLMNYKMIIDLGIITVNEKYANVYDYLNTQCILHLPYFDSIYLNAEYVINQSLHIEYVVDFYTGSTTANIYSSFIDDIIQSVKANVYVSVPFVQGQINGVVGTLNGIYNHNKNYAYMEVTRNIPYNQDTPFGKKTNDYGMIGNYTGYIKVGDMNLISSATVDEQSEIMKLLAGGVFINE